jgi:putative transposase
MLVRYRFRFYPNAPQRRILGKTFGCVRYVYNRALALRKDAYADDKTKINYAQTSAALTQWKKDPGLLWLKEVSCVPLQQCLRHLQTAYNGFFAKRAAYPRFKSKRGEQSAEFTRSAFRWDGKQSNLTLAKIGHLRIRWSRQFASEPSTVTIIKDCAGRYFATLCLDETVAALPKTGESVGIDLGILHLATLSTGETIPNPKFLGRSLVRLAKHQRSLARRKQGSHRWQRQRLKVARLHAHVADSRRDLLAKLTTGLVRRFDVCCVEDLHVGGMMDGHDRARRMSDVGMYAFRQMLTYKCRWYGKELLVVDRYFPSSKRCSDCQHVLESMPLSVRSWNCPCCGVFHDRDHNAAKNILSAGQAASARGGHVRPKATPVAKGHARRSVNQPALP